MVQGTQGADVIVTGGGDDYVAGGGGRDRICVGSGKDFVDGGTADDRIDAGGGRDELHGYDGDDRILGGGGADFLDGRRGHDLDVLIGGAGNDRALGGVRLKGGPGDDRLDSESYSRSRRVDRVVGGPGDDRLHADGSGGLGDLLRGGGGADRLTGDRNDDDLGGGSGDDNLRGLGGDDRLDGGPDTDTCDQGPGSGPVLNCELPRAARVIAETRVTISRFLPLYHGRVKSAFKDCERGRKVILYRKRPGKDQIIGKDRADIKGRWREPAPANLAPGDRFYAKVRNLEVNAKGTGLSCIRDKSRTVTFVGD
jgi:Ca2+-binding RTX toxin-like protein